MCKECGKVEAHKQLFGLCADCYFSLPGIDDAHVIGGYHTTMGAIFLQVGEDEQGRVVSELYVP